MSDEKLCCAVLALAAITIPAHAAIYKCVVNGEMVFRDTPCVSGNGSVIHVQSVSSNASTPTVHAVQPNDDPDNTKSIAQFLAQKKIEHERSDLHYQISQLQQQKHDLASKEKTDLLLLRVKKLNAANNLAGATYEESISQEMQARVTQYQSDAHDVDAQIVDLQHRLDNLSDVH